jgi:hypothetical protein
MIFAESASLTPGRPFSSAAVAVLMSTIPAFGTPKLPCAAGSEGLGEAGIAGAIVPVGGVGVVVVVAGCAKTGAAKVNASSPMGRRESFNIDIS